MSELISKDEEMVDAKYARDFDWASEPIARQWGGSGGGTSKAGDIETLPEDTVKVLVEAVANGGIKIAHSTCAVVVEAQKINPTTPAPPVLGRCIYLPDGWRLLTGDASEIRKAFAALKIWRATPAKTIVEIIE